MYKPAHLFAKQVTVLVSTRRGFLLKGTSGQASVSSLLPHYQVDFLLVQCQSLVSQFAKLYLILWLHLLIIRYVCLKCYLLCGALLLIFRLDITCIVLLMCCTTDVSLEFPTIYQHFCFVPLASRFHWKVQYLFCIFCF